MAVQSPNYGPLTMTNSYMMNNSAAGGIGGAMFTQDAPANVANSTFINNSADGAGYGGGALLNWGSMTVTNSTLDGNSTGGSGGGGIGGGSGSPLLLVNTIIANSTGGDCVGMAATGYDNLMTDPGNACGFTDGVDGNILGVDPLLVDVGIAGVLGLQPGSPAIDAGDDAACAAAPVNGIDQRFMTRPQGPHCDIGAFEASDTALQLIKSAEPLVYGANGDMITYTYQLVNVGAVSLAGPFAVVDDKLGTINPCGAGPLAAGESTSCAVLYSVTSQDMEGVSIINHAYAEDTNSATVSPSAQAQVDKAAYEMSLAKSADRATYSIVGDVINYLYEITNQGNVPLEAPFTVIDDKLGTINPCGAGPLAPWESTNCSVPYTVTQADIDFGSITNEAFAQGGGATSCSDCNNTVTVTWIPADATPTPTPTTTPTSTPIVPPTLTPTPTNTPTATPSNTPTGTTEPPPRPRTRRPAPPNPRRPRTRRPRPHPTRRPAPPNPRRPPARRARPQPTRRLGPRQRPRRRTPPSP